MRRYTDLRDEGDLRQAVDQMLLRVHGFSPTARISGFTVQAMAHRPMAQELIVRASIDALFGPVLTRDLVSRTRVARLLAGYRDHPAVYLDAVCDVLIALSQMLADLPELAELDINPLWAD